MFMDKKAQGLSINTIVVSAIAVVILVVLILVFTGKIGLFNKNVSACAQNGGHCTTDASCGDNARNVNYQCPDDNQICCMSVPNS